MFLLKTFSDMLPFSYWGKYNIGSQLRHDKLLSNPSQFNIHQLSSHLMFTLLDIYRFVKRATKILNLVILFHFKICLLYFSHLNWFKFSGTIPIRHLCVKLTSSDIARYTLHSVTNVFSLMLFGRMIIVCFGRHTCK
jgi:hypothetical protein